MKKVILIASLSMSIFTSAFSQINVGSVTNGKINQKEGLEKLIPILKSNLLELSSLNVDYNTVKVIEFDGKYYLQFLGGSFKTTFQVTKDNSGNLIAADKVSCTTSACASEPQGCVPGLGNYCTPCANKGTCTKTVSNQSLL
ncbi:MAG: hypothetical protein JSU03_03470 [Bacteroidetes bacterium]|nr:hypothetical protein [Bacteroidota bacterium]